MKKCLPLHSKNGGTAVAVEFRKRRAERNFEKKLAKRFARFKVSTYLCTRNSKKRGAKNEREYIEIMR